jgi:ABC-type transport system substrate-binding protein
VVRIRAKSAAFLVLLAGLLIPLLGGCGSAADAHPQAILRLPLYGDARRLDAGLLDPARATSATPVYAASLLYSGLVKLGPDLHVIPELAVSLPTISSSGRTYTFTIRQDARFADGHACTARDVIYSLTRALEPGIGSSLARRYLGGIQGAGLVEDGLTTHLSGISALDSLTVRIRLLRPDATFLGKLAFPIAAIIEHATGRHPAGLGPWAVEGGLPDGTIILSPRSHFYGGSLGYRQTWLVPVKGLFQGIELYRKGQVDAAEVPYADVQSMQDRPEFHQSESVDAYYAITSPGLARLLAAHLDRDALVATTSPSLSALDAIVPPAVPDYVASAPATPATASPARLRPIELTFSHHDPALAAIAGALRSQWPVLSAARDRVELIHQSFELPDPGRWLLTALPRTGSRWFRSVLAQANRLTNDPVSRMNLYSEGEDWALQQNLVVPLASGSISYLIRSTVQNLLVTPIGLMPQNNTWSLITLQ